jgi:hypothetical protein
MRRHDRVIKHRRLVIAALIACLASAVYVWGPLGLREVSWFQVAEVEVSGARLLSPAALLGASGIAEGANLWDDSEPWVAALRSYPGISDASVHRRLPGTLRIRIREEPPVAYVEADPLRPATASGDILPLDPGRQPLDLPIVRGAWSNGEDAGARRLLAEAGRLDRLDPPFMARVSEISLAEEGGDALILIHAAGEIITPFGIDATRVAELHAVLDELNRGGASRPIDIDLRYRDQIIVRTTSSTSDHS